MTSQSPNLPVLFARALTPEEKTSFDEVYQRLREDFSSFNCSSDRIQLELASIYYVKVAGAYSEGDWESVERIDKMLRAHLKDLQATRMARKAEKGEEQGQTLAEYLSQLNLGWKEEGSDNDQDEV